MRVTDLRTAFIFSLLWDREGSLWVGTSDGLYHLHSNPIECFGASAGLGPISGLSVGPSGLWASVFSRGVYLQQDTVWTKQAEMGDSSADSQTVETAKGEVWLSTAQDCYRFREGKAKVTLKIGGNACFCHKGKTLWIVNSTNVFMFRNEQLAPMSEGWPAMNVTCVTTNHDGGLLIGTTQGLYKWGGQFTKWIDFGESLPGTRINDLQWEKETLWLASDQALARYQDVWQVVRGDVALAQVGGINSMIVESNGLWLGGVNGLFRIHRSELNQYLRGEVHELPLVQYGRVQGMPWGYVGPSYSRGQGAVRGDDGRLWFACKNGVLAVNAAENLNVKPAPVVIERVLIDRQPVSNPGGYSQEAIRLPAGTKNVEIDYAALTYVAPDRVMYQYRLEGLNPDWINVGHNRVARFTTLPPRNYEFQIRACNAEGIWSELGGSIRFVQQPFFYQTRAFFWLCFILGIATVLLVTTIGTMITHAVSTRKMRHRLVLLEAQQAMNRERARIARDIHDDVGSTLTRIVLLSELAGRKPEETFTPDGHLATIRSAAREITRRLDEIVWAINPRNDTLDALVSYISKLATDQTRAGGLRCRLDLPSTLPPWVIDGASRHNIYLACKEAINNAVKHAAASQLQLRLTLNGDGFQIEVCDNGLGLPSPMPAPSGDGMVNLRERLAAIGGSCDFSSTPGEGTVVRFHVTLPKPGKAQGKINS